MIIGQSNHTVHHTGGDKVLTYFKFKRQFLQKHFSGRLNLGKTTSETCDKIW